MPLVIISYYEQRPTRPLEALLESMQRFDAGQEYEACIVVNRTGGGSLRLPDRPEVIAVLERENTGMNIGAWEHGWRAFPEHDAYLFLQDECFAVAADWLAAFQRRAEDAGVGLIGETLNEKWDRPWSQLATLWAAHDMPGHYVDGLPAKRVDAYLDFFRRQGIDAGSGGRHLRSLVWYAKRAVLERIGGFPVGANYGECIAAEIAVSKKVEAVGLAVVQVAQRPFTYIRHSEWVPDPGNPNAYRKAR